MAKTSYLTIPVGWEEIIKKSMCSGSRFVNARVRRNDTLLSKKRKNGVSQRSLLPQLSIIWATLTTEQKQAWSDSGAIMGLNGWQIFVQEMCIRIINDMSLEKTPVLTHQSWFGNIKLISGADEIKLVQPHPSSYYILKKVRGTKSQYNPVLVQEGFGLPLKIGISYKSNLTASGPNPYAKFYAKIWNSYQAKDDEHELLINLDLIHDWQTVENTLTTLRGSIIAYALYIECHDVIGDLYIDNCIAYHNAQNWARDAGFKSFAITFTKAFYQIPKNWAAEILPVGAEYDTVYLDF
jgi:hypothetical protein